MRTAAVLLVAGLWTAAASAQQLFELPSAVETRYSFENPTGARGEKARLFAAWRRVRP